MLISSPLRISLINQSYISIYFTSVDICFEVVVVAVVVVVVVVVVVFR